jgi:hypothetical protein
MKSRRNAVGTSGAHTVLKGGGPMDYLDREQQLFVRQQICNWVLGLNRRFIEMNGAWSGLGAQAYFWS